MSAVNVRDPTEQLVDTFPRPVVDYVVTRGISRSRARLAAASPQQEVGFAQLLRERHFRLNPFRRVRVNAADKHHNIG